MVLDTFHGGFLEGSGSHPYSRWDRHVYRGRNTRKRHSKALRSEEGTVPVHQQGVRRGGSLLGVAPKVGDLARQEGRHAPEVRPCALAPLPTHLCDTGAPLPVRS